MSLLNTCVTIKLSFSCFFSILGRDCVYHCGRIFLFVHFFICLYKYSWGWVGSYLQSERKEKVFEMKIANSWEVGKWIHRWGLSLNSPSQKDSLLLQDFLCSTLFYCSSGQQPNRLLWANERYCILSRSVTEDFQLLSIS